jgi:hypothetical protein
MKKVYYVGDWAILTGPVFAETPFHHSPKGLEIFNYGIWLKEALEKDPSYQVNSVSAWDFYNNLLNFLIEVNLEKKFLHFQIESDFL